MRLNTRIVIDMATLKVIERESTEYDGPIAHCGGGGGSSEPTYDEAYNKRMANVAERQQAMSEEYFKFWEKHGKPYEKAKIKANMELMPYEVETRKAEMETQQLGMEMRQKEMKMAEPVAEEYYKQALEGVDVGEEVQQARSDVAQGLQETEGEMSRHMSRLGVDPSSPAYMERMKAGGMEKAKMVGGAMSAARRSAEQTNFGRLAQATQTAKQAGGI